MDHLTALRVFREVARANGFAAAGRVLGLSAPAISKNIAELEAHAGARLINRTTRRMSLTEAGRTYLDHVTRALDAIPGFLDRHPDLRLDLHLDDRRVDIVREGLDLAIRGTDRLEDSSLVARRLAVMPHVLCAAPGYFAAHGTPRSPADLAAHNCILFSLAGHPGTWEFGQGGRTRRVAVGGRYAVSSSLAVRDAVRAGFGLTMIPRPYVKDDLRDGSLVSAMDDWITSSTTLYAIYPSREHLAPKNRVFVDFLIGEFAG